MRRTWLAGSGRRRPRLLLAATACMMLVLFIVPPLAFGDGSTLESLTDKKNADLALAVGINGVWVIVAGVLVMFMQAGFAFLEIGFSRGKNAGTVVAKILVNFAIAALMFWACGFAFAFGAGNDIIGTSGFFVAGVEAGKNFPLLAINGGVANITVEELWFFQFVFCAVSLAIVWGTTLERIKFGVYIIYAIVFAGILYPIGAHWIFGGGWLQVNVGMQDFAGSTVVHLIGASGALAVLLLLGPRKGKYGPDGKTPVQNGTINVKLRCIIPRASLDGPIATGTRPVIYGHGLFGTAEQGWRSNKIDYAFDSGLTICATEFAGMADEDVNPTTIHIIQDLSGFKQMADRIQQGLLDFMFVGRSMIKNDGLVSSPAFQDGDGTTPGANPVIDTSKQLAYFGISEGGILGGSLTAVEPDITNAVLNVPGMGYSTLLPRSTDFAEFASLLYPSYPDQRGRPLLFSLMQMLWDRGEASGYSQHMTSNPLPGTPAHRVLMQVAYGDHQVANITAATEARTLGLSTRDHLLDAGREPGMVDPFWGIPRLGAFPAQTSGITLWDAGPIRITGSVGTQDERVEGNNPAPWTNQAPVDAENGEVVSGTYHPAVTNDGRDPHGAPGDTPAARQQLGDFLNTGSITDTCLAGKPCYSRGYTGP